jgi:pre-mRNA-splicing factor ATP-dependent RNA helicase DHX38/PRP16
LREDEKRLKDPGLDIENEYSAFEWEEMEREADRQWYDNFEGGGAMEDAEEYYFIGDKQKFHLIEEQLEMQRKEGASKKGNLKQNEKNAEHNKWELNRMLTSGVFKLNELKNDLDEDEDHRVVLMVHDIKPPFLSENFVYSTQTEQVQVVKDPTSDFAILAKKGSAILRQIRERNDRSKMRERFWELAGSKLGKLLKIEKQEEQPDPDINLINEAGDIDYKKSGQYAMALAKKSEAVSDFAKSKTIKEQREYLPIFSVRRELMKVIADGRV